jgi:hypothetical protein
MRARIRCISALSEPITLYLALCMGLKIVPNASDPITRKSLIRKEMLRVVSAPDESQKRSGAT